MVGYTMDNNDPVSFYPTKRHFEKGWAPETSLTTYDVAALARAARYAERTGVLSPELAQKLLPMAMTEGRSNNYGIVRSDEKNAFWGSKKNRQVFEKMGLTITEPGGGGDIILTPIKAKKGLFLMPGEDTADYETNARISAAMLALKSGGGRRSVEAAVKAYNGQGRALEDLGGGRYQQADADNHLRKFKEADELLLDPKNDGIRSLWEQEYARAAKPEPPAKGLMPENVGQAMAPPAAPQAEESTWDKLIRSAKQSLGW